MESNFLRTANLVTILVVLCSMGGHARPVHDDGNNELGEGSAEGGSLDGVLRDFEGDPVDNDVPRPEDEEVDEEFRPVPMPSDFRSYDVLNPDGYISLAELINVTGAVVNVHEAFRASDLDNDGRLSEAEFYTAPWMLAGDDATAAAAASSVPTSGDSHTNNLALAGKSETAETRANQEKPSGDVTPEVQHGHHNGAMGNT